MKHRRIGFWYRLAAIILRRPMMLLTRRDWSGAEHLGSGGAVVVVNHVSYFDPLAFAHFVDDAGRAPRFLGKAEVFEIPVVGRLISAAGQIPVHRETVNAASAVREAVAAVTAGECVVVYPEATLTRDEHLWPMVGKTGAARIALTTGCPVIPVAQWGPQEVLGGYEHIPRLLPRKVMHVRAGPSVDLARFADRELDAAVLREATDTIMAAIVSMLELIRGESAPVERFDPRARGGPPIGKPEQTDRPEGER